MKKRKKKNTNDTIIGILTFFVVLLGSVFRNNILVLAFLLIVSFGGYAAWTWHKKRCQQDKYLKSGMHDVDKLTGEEFEYFLCTYFKALGYKAKTTPPINDYGADVIAKKDGETIVIQAKRYKGKVGIKAVQEAIGARGYYNAQKAMVITCSSFTINAEKLAAECNVELWDRQKLKSVMEEIQGQVLVDAMKSQEMFKQLDRTCPKCRAHMVLRHGKYGDFYGCENYPDCTYTKIL